jgi:HK97 family phage prohead protease
VKRKYIEAVDLTALGEGEMVALASTFGDVEKHGDRVIRGAYSTDVAKLKAGASLPLVWGHDVNGSPQNFVGEIHDADETDEGLKVRARFDLDDPVARKAYRLVKQGAIVACRLDGSRSRSSVSSLRRRGGSGRQKPPEKDRRVADCARLPNQRSEHTG